MSVPVRFKGVCALAVVAAIARTLTVRAKKVEAW
jgi:hypothetical protein